MHRGPVAAGVIGQEKLQEEFLFECRGEVEGEGVMVTCFLNAKQQVPCVAPRHFRESAL